jgi:two-component system sensor histidine kinase RegB
MQGSPDTDARRLRLDTLVRLRWLAVAGQAATILVVHFGLGFTVPIEACLVIIGLSAFLNLSLRVRYPVSVRLEDSTAAVLLGYDTLQLAALLYLTGGLENPFALLFLAPVMISATALSPLRTLLLGALAVGAASFLAKFHLPLPWHQGQAVSLPLLYVAGVWLAILLGLAFIGVYAWRVAEEARQLSEALAATELVLAHEQHLSQLDGLAAAAAHELGTPLATIALVARELQRTVPADSPYREDIQLLQEQAARCRSILSKLASLGDEKSGPLHRMTLAHLVEDITAPQRAFGIEVSVVMEGEAPEPDCDRNPGILYGLANIVDNAIDFAVANVVVTASWDHDNVSIGIRDDGPGFAPEVLGRLGEPYISSRGSLRGREKPREGGGLGLGLFIAKTLLERSGAAFSASNRPSPPGGASVVVVWQREVFEGRTRAQAAAKRMQPANRV